MTYLEKVYRRTMETALSEFGTGEGMDVWQWFQGVALYGLGKVYEKTHDNEIISFMKKWIDFHLDKMDFGYSINTTAPLLGVIKLLEIGEGNERYEEICEKFASWCMSEAPRADRGAFEHSCTQNTYDNQVWADTLFMGCIFLVKWGLYKKDNTFIKEAIRQFKLHYSFLADENGLIYHGYDCNERARKGVLWGRGNGWLAVASPEVLSLIPNDMPGYDEILANWKKQLDAAVEFQREDGGWCTVMNRNDTYLEMSVTAAFACGLGEAKKHGLTDEKYITAAKKGIECLIKHIDEKGNVLRGSIGTCVMEDYKKYNDVGFGYSYFSQGLAMIALINE